jgi:hypothetical protein
MSVDNPLGEYSDSKTNLFLEEQSCSFDLLVSPTSSLHDSETVIAGMKSEEVLKLGLQIMRVARSYNQLDHCDGYFLQELDDLIQGKTAVKRD